MGWFDWIDNAANWVSDQFNNWVGDRVDEYNWGDDSGYDYFEDPEYQYGAVYYDYGGQDGWAYEEEYVDDGSGGGGGGGSSTGGGGGASTGGANGAAASTAPPKSSFSEEEISYLQDMPFSNVPSYYKYDEDDLMYKAATNFKDYYWGLKEEMFLYTMHDQEKHRYITSIQVDGDAEEIVTTCTVTMPYKNELMEYYVPGQTVFMIIGGTFDREVLFIGRVSEVNQYGQEIQVVGQNIGWKFKQYMSQEFFEKLQGQPVPLVVKAIFKELGFEDGKYVIDLWGIPNIDSYQIDENGSIVRDGEVIEDVPDLEEVVSRLQDNEIDKYAASVGETNSTELVAEDYEANVEMRRIDSVVNATDYMNVSSNFRVNTGVSTTYDEENGISYDPLEERLFGTDNTPDYFVGDKTGDSDHTYEDILKNIKAALDAQFFIVDTTVCFISFNSLMSMRTTEAITKQVYPLIEFWQMQEDSYELEINQYGFYNTVIINYKDGTLKKAYDDLVRVYGEIPIEYDEPELDSVGASLKAQSYLSAHIRDFGMQVRLSMLGTGKIIASSFIRVRNPLTMSESLFYVYGVQLNWSAKGQALTADLDMRYGPENPNPPEVPEAGATYDTSGGTGEVYGGEISADVATAAKQMIGNATNEIDKAQRIYNWVAQNVQYEFYYDNKYSTSQVLTGKRANCYDTSMLIYELCSAVGVRCEVHTGNYQFLDGTYGHVWNMLPTASGFQFADAGRQSPEAIGVHGEGRGILSDSLMQKNY